MSFDVSNIGKVIYSQCDSIIHCYPVMAPQKTPAPYLVYHTLRTEPDNVKGVIAPVDIATILIDVYDTTHANATAKGVLVRSLLDRIQGTFGGVPVDEIVYITEQQDFDDQLKLNIVTLEFSARIKNTGTSVTVQTPPTSILTQNTTLTDIIPAGYRLESVITKNDTLLTLSIGTTPGGTDIMNNVDIVNWNNQTVFQVFSMTAKQTLYITALSWPCSVSIYFVTTRII